MPEDRFGDLRPRHGDPAAADADAEEERRAGRAAERLVREDELEGSVGDSDEPPPPRPYAMAFGAALLGLGLLLLILVATGVIGAARERGGSVRGPAPGSLLRPFAAPLATGRLEGDANVKPRPGPPDPQVRPACQVTGPDVVNLCELRRRPLVLSFIVLRGTECEPELDVFQRVSRDFPEVAFAAVVSGESRSSVEAIVRRRGIEFPVAVDRDGAVVNVNGIGVCPTTTFASSGGRVRETRLGALGEPQLRGAVRDLLRAGRGR